MGLYDSPKTSDEIRSRYYADTTRSSVQTWPFAIPVDKTLAVADTAEDILNLTSAYTEPTRNIITNPSIETNTTGWSAAGSTLARVNTFAQFNTWSLRCITDNAATGEGFYWELAENPPSLKVDRTDDAYTFSVYLRGAAGTETVFLRFWNSSEGYIGNSAVFTLSAAGFVRYHLTIKPRSMGTTRLYVVTNTQQSSTFYMDGAQFERWSGPTAYCDGAQSRLTKWEGTAHASTSVRNSAPVEIRGFDLHFNLDTYVDFDRVATNSSIPILAGSTWSPQNPIGFKRMSFLNINGAETPRVRGVIWAVPQTGVSE